MFSSAGKIYPVKITARIVELIHKKSEYFNLYKLGFVTKEENISFKYKLMSIMKKKL